MGKINNSFKITRNKLNIVPSQKKKKKNKYRKSHISRNLDVGVMWILPYQTTP